MERKLYRNENYVQPFSLPICDAFENVIKFSGDIAKNRDKIKTFFVSVEGRGEQGEDV